MNAQPIFVASLVCLAVSCHQAGAQAPEGADQNWHQWRGPLATGEAPNADPPLHWNSDTNIAWKTPIPGRGSGTPIVWNDRLFVTTAIATDEPPPAVQSEEEPREEGRRGGRGGRFGQAPPKQLYEFKVYCLDRETGKVVWERSATKAVPHEGLHQTNTYASASPITDGEHLWAFFGSYGLYCYDLDGNEIWQRDLGDMRTRSGFGEGASPALYQETLVVNWDHEGQSFITALDARTGDQNWKVDRDEPTTWVTPLIVEGAGKVQVIVNASNRVRSYDLANGEVIWECGGQVGNPIPTPVTLDGVVYCMTGFRGSALYAIPLDSQGDITDTDKIAWSSNRNTPYVPSPLLYDGCLYFTKGNEAILTVLEAKTGQNVAGPKRLAGISSIYASPVAAKDRIYITGRDGTTLVFQHGDNPQLLATNALDDPIDASPALVGDRIFLRGEKHIYCIRGRDE